MNIEGFKKKIAEIVADRGRPEKAYIGDLETLELVRTLVTDTTILNPKRYEGEVVLRYGLKYIEVIPDKEPKPDNRQVEVKTPKNKK